MASRQAKSVCPISYRPLIQSVCPPLAPCTGLRNLPERHRSMCALFEQSWRLLSPLEQGVLMRLSVFRGGWRLEEAAPVTGATLSLLLDLVDKSLVRTDGQNRFDLHDLVRQYAAEQRCRAICRKHTSSCTKR
jgi:predicted ATPase